MKTIVGIYQISIPTDGDHNAFEKLMKIDGFSKVEAGNQTHGDIVTAQYFLKNESPDLSTTTLGSFVGKTRETHPLVLEMLPPVLPPTHRLRSQNLRLFRILYAGFAGLNEFSKLSALSRSPKMFGVNICIQDPIEPNLIHPIHRRN